MPYADSAPAKSESFSGFIFLRQIAAMRNVAATVTGGGT
jgi:hypothetical protein